MLQTVLIALAAIVFVLIVVVATRSADFRIVRSATITATAATVFGQVNDFHNWRNWSPWEKIDLELKRTYEGPPSGVGAVYSWVGNKHVGEGRMTIIESRPSELIQIKLEFLKPFKATNTAEFTFQPEGNHTLMTWNMIGHNNFIMKAFGLFMNMDKMIGADFEKGLANLKAVVESPPQS